MMRRRLGAVGVTIAVALGVAGCSPTGDDPLAGFEENTYTGGDEQGLEVLQALASATWTPTVGTVDVDDATAGGSASEAIWGQSEPQLSRVFSFPDQATLESEMAALRAVVEADGFTLTPLSNDRECCRFYEGPLGVAEVVSFISSADGLPTMTLDVTYIPDLPPDVVAREEQRAATEPPD